MGILLRTRLIISEGLPATLKIIIFAGSPESKCSAGTGTEKRLSNQRNHMIKINLQYRTSKPLEDGVMPGLHNLD